MERKGTILFVFFLIIISASLFLIWPQSETTTNTIIYGKVKDAISDKPIAKAQITASGITVQSTGTGDWKLIFQFGGTFKIKITKPGFTEVYRTITLNKGSEDTVSTAYLTPLEPRSSSVVEFEQQGSKKVEMVVFSNGGGSIQLRIPKTVLGQVKVNGVLKDISKDVQITRLSGSRALPGELSRTPNMKFPIAFLFCAEIGPSGAEFIQPVTLRVKNTWGFLPGTEIPVAFWDTKSLEWVGLDKQAMVDSKGEWIQASIKHLSSYDINSPQSFGGGIPIVDVGPFPDDYTCDIGSGVNVTTGSLMNSVSVPGVNAKNGPTDLELIYTSKTAFPTEVLRVWHVSDTRLVDKPQKMRFSIRSSLITSSGVRKDAAPTEMTFNFSPFSGIDCFYGMGTVIVNGRFPSGQKVGTGFQTLHFSWGSEYKGTYYKGGGWGGMPTQSTGVLMTEPETFNVDTDLDLFMVSNEDSCFGKGWGLSGVDRLCIQGPKVGLIRADGSYKIYEKGENFAGESFGARVCSHTFEMEKPENLFISQVLKNAQQLPHSRFSRVSLESGSNQLFVVDLGQVRSISQIGLSFPQYWEGLNVWDVVKISTSPDNKNWSDYYQFGKDTLRKPEEKRDPLDFKIRSPLLWEKEARSVRYIKFELGFPSVNTKYKGSGIYQVYAFGNSSRFHSVDGEIYPKMEAANSRYIVTEYNGETKIFDKIGRMIERKNIQGEQTCFSYDSSNHLTRIDYPGKGVFTVFNYSGGRLSSITDASGRVTRIESDGEGQIQRVVYPDQTTREFDYDSRGLMTMDKSGDAVKTYTWDKEWPVLREVGLPNRGKRTITPAVLTYLLNPLANSTASIPFPFIGRNDGIDSKVIFEDESKVIFHEGKGRRLTERNGRHQQTVYFANSEFNRLPTKIVSGVDQSQTIEIKYNADLQISGYWSNYRDFSWFRSPIFNNPWVKGSGTEEIKGPSIGITYNESHQVSQVTGNDLKLTYSYDKNLNLIEEKNGNLGTSTRYKYDSENKVTQVTFPDGTVNKFTYDSNSLVSDILSNSGKKTSVLRNTRGEIVQINDEENRVTRLDRDMMGRIVKETSPSGRSIRYEYGRSGCASCGSGPDRLLSKVIDEANNVYQFKYDSMGNPIEMIYPNGGSISQEFDIVGNLTRFTNGRRQDIHYAYDTDNRLIKKVTPEGVTSFAYDDKDRPIAIYSPDYQFSFSYGAAGGSYGNHLVQETNLTTGHVSQYVLNVHGLPVETYDSFKWKKRYDYNFTQPGGTAIGFTPYLIDYQRSGSETGHFNTILSYDNANRLTRKQNNYLNTDMFLNYDSDGNLSRIRYQNAYGASGFPSIDNLIERDGSGIITAMKGDMGFSASYNRELELTGVTHSQPFGFSEGYTYENRGNRLSSQTASFHYDSRNRITESTDHVYEHDLDGNLIEDKNTKTGETKKYGYSSENQLMRYEHIPAGSSVPDVVAEYKYDPFGRRLQKKVNGIVTNFFWEGDNLAYELDSNFNPIRRYVYSSGIDDVEGYLEYAEAASFPLESSKKGWYTYIKDPVGTPYKVYNNFTKQVVETRGYDSFGNLTNRTGNSTGNLGFQGKYFDSESGLYYFYHRYYNPVIGRFTSEDPIGLEGGLNLYGALNNNPMNWVDPKGLIILPPDPSGLPHCWQQDFSHTPRDGSKWVHPGGLTIEYHKGNPKIHQRPHWHLWVGGRKTHPHLYPGTWIPGGECPDKECEKKVKLLLLIAASVWCVLKIAGTLAICAL